MKKKVNRQPLLLKVINKQTANFNQIIDPVLKQAGKLILSLSILIFAFSISSFEKPSWSKKKLANDNNGFSNEKTFKKERRAITRKEKDSVSVPHATINLFHARFPKAQIVNWSNIDGYSVADFNSGSSKMMAFFGFNGKLEGTGKYISYDALPKNSLKEIDRHFNNYTPVSVIDYHDNQSNGNESIDNDLDVFQIPVNSKGYYALMKDKGHGKEIILQISSNGEVSFYGNAS